MPFHQFCRPNPIPNDKLKPIRKNPFDLLLHVFGVKRLGLDAIADYCRHYASNDVEIKPWLPDGIPDSAFLLDFHSHTSFSDGEGTYESILREIGRLKFLNGIAFTDHPWHLAPDHKTRIPNEKVVQNSYKARDVVIDLKKKDVLPESFLTFEGSAEFAPKGTLDFPTKGVELIGLGLPRDFIESNGGLRRLRKFLAEDLVDKIHDAGGIAIIPHPFYFINSSSIQLWRSVDAVESFNQTTHFMVEPIIQQVIERSNLDEVPLLDSVLSVRLIFGYFAWRNRVQLAKYPVPEVGSSDAHIEPFVGAGCTAFEEPVLDLEDLRKRLRRKEGTAMINPRWEATAKFDEILDRIWGHWGAELAKKIGAIEKTMRFLLPPLKLLTATFKRIQSTHYEINNYKSIGDKTKS